MSTHKDGGPASPTDTWNYDGANNVLPFQTGGMTLRDWFAGMALQGLLTQRLEIGDYEPRVGRIEDDAGTVYKGGFISPAMAGDEYEAARDAYSFADAMIYARERKEES